MAVILNGHEETSRLNEANLSDFYLDDFKDYWTEFDKSASGLIKVTDLKSFLGKIPMPFDYSSMNFAIMKMYLPIISIAVPPKKEGAEVKH